MHELICTDTQKTCTLNQLNVIASSRKYDEYDFLSGNIQFHHI